MGPPPRTRAESPSLNGEMSTECHPTDSGSTRAPISRGTLSGSFLTAYSGTTVDSHKPPPKPLKPIKPFLSQQLTKPLWQDRQSPSKRIGWTHTLSPFCTFVTPSPTSSTMPENSCPKVNGYVSSV